MENSAIGLPSSRDPVRHGHVPLLLLLVLATAFFTLTFFLNRTFRRWQERLAHHWFTVGEQQLGGNDALGAVQAFRSSLYYAPAQEAARLQLAEALETAGRIVEARVYLAGLWQDQPDNGLYNLELAHLAAKAGDVNTALRYFHGAIFGVWPVDQAATRPLQVRFELIEFLLQSKATAQAQVELLVLGRDLPPDVGALLHAAQLNVRAGSDQEAFTLYRNALRLQPANAEAVAGAGLAAFRQGHYGSAVHLLRLAVQRHASDSAAAGALRQAELGLSLDPYETNLSGSQRRSRALEVLELIASRLDLCRAAAASAETGSAPSAAGPANGPYVQALSRQVRDFRMQVSGSRLAAHPQTLDALMDFTTQALQQAESCAPADATTQALLLIAEKREDLSR